MPLTCLADAYTSGAATPSNRTCAPAILLASLPLASSDAPVSTAGPRPFPYATKIIPGDTVPTALLAAFATALTTTAGGGGGGGAGAPNRARNASPFNRPTKLNPPNFACCASAVAG